MPESQPIPTADEVTRRIRRALRQSLEDLLAGRPQIRFGPSPKTFRPEPDAGHYHPLPEIFIQRRGVSRFIMPGRRILLKPGQMLIVPPYLAHDEYVVRPAAPFANLVGAFTDEGATWHESHGLPDGRPRPVQSVLFVSRSGFVPIISYLNDAIAAATQRGEFHRQRTCAAMTLALSGLISRLEASTPPAPIVHPKALLCDHYLRRNLSVPSLSVRRLAGRVGLSPNYLSALFTREFGESINQRLSRLRLRQAQRLLREETMNIAEIAFACGFTDPAYFSRWFTQHTAQSPRTFRQRNGA